jgi:hypothetical protein
MSHRVYRGRIAHNYSWLKRSLKRSLKRWGSGAVILFPSQSMEPPNELLYLRIEQSGREKREDRLNVGNIITALSPIKSKDDSKTSIAEFEKT